MKYLASPYSHPNPNVRLARFTTVCIAAGQLMNAGEIIFSPIAHTHPIAVTCDLPLGFDYWEKYDREMLAACDEIIVLMLDGWRESKGVQAEIAIMKEMGKPVRFMPWLIDETPL